VYLEQLLPRMAQAHAGDRYAVVVPHGGAGGLPAGPGVDEVPTRLDGRAPRAAAALAGRPRLDRLAGGCDVAWAPAPAPLAVGPVVPLVLTVHDLSFEHRPADYGAYERLWHRLARPRRLARRAARVIAVSEPVRAQLIAEWNLEPERVVMVRSGPGRPPGIRGRLPEGLEPGFLLAVGALEPRKRPELLLEAHARARRRGLRAELVLAGAGRAPRAQGAGGVRVLGRVPDVTLEALYPAALALVCASREEGFGFTPLEALARGTPAVVADLAPFRETLGDAALRVPPGDPEALADAMLRVEREDGLSTRLREAARGVVEALSWERAAGETRRVLAAAAQGAP